MSHTSSNGNNSPKSNSKVERSSLSIHICSSNSKNSVESNKKVLVQFLIGEKMKVLGHRMKEDLTYTDMKDL